MEGRRWNEGRAKSMRPSKATDVSPEQLRELLHYNPETGVLTWKARLGELFSQRWNTRYADKPAFAFRNKEGYLMGTLSHRSYLAHRLIWAWMTGAWPSDEIDHINRNPSDNRWINLRVVNRSQQVANRIKLPPGVERNKHRYGLPYQARIMVRGCSRYLGTFNTPDEAHQAYLEAAKTNRSFVVSANDQASKSKVKMKTPELDPALLRNLMDYDPETGELRWKPKAGTEWQISWNIRHAGKPALAASNGGFGHLVGQLSGRKCYAHRAIWAWMTGSWPEKAIDHINGNPTDNRWENLRLATPTEQQRNRSYRRTAHDLPRGVYRNNQIGGRAYISHITVDGVAHYLGAFHTPEEAHAAYLEATAHYGAYAYHKSRE